MIILINYIEAEILQIIYCWKVGFKNLINLYFCTKEERGMVTNREYISYILFKFIFFLFIFILIYY